MSSHSMNSNKAIIIGIKITTDSFSGNLFNDAKVLLVSDGKSWNNDQTGFTDELWDIFFKRTNYIIDIETYFERWTKVIAIMIGKSKVINNISKFRVVIIYETD